MENPVNPFERLLIFVFYNSKLPISLYHRNLGIMVHAAEVMGRKLYKWSLFCLGSFSHFGLLLLDMWAFLVWVYWRHRNFPTIYPSPTHVFSDWPLRWRLSWLCQDWGCLHESFPTSQETLRCKAEKMSFRIQCLEYFSTCNPEARISGEDPYQVNLDNFDVFSYPLNLWNITKSPYPK